jgi:hypothetical protein
MYCCPLRVYNLALNFKHNTCSVAILIKHSAWFRKVADCVTLLNLVKSSFHVFYSGGGKKLSALQLENVSESSVFYYNEKSTLIIYPFTLTDELNIWYTQAEMTELLGALFASFGCEYFREWNEVPRILCTVETLLVKRGLSANRLMSSSKYFCDRWEYRVKTMLNNIW